MTVSPNSGHMVYLLVVAHFLIDAGIIWNSTYAESDSGQGSIMEMNRLNHWLTFGANIGVVAGLVFLAVELNQNTKATIAAASEVATNQSLEYFALGMDNQVIARARYKHSVGEELSAFEKNQLWWHQYYNFRIFENVFLQFRRGYYEEREWKRYEKIIHFRLTTDPFAQQMWEDRAFSWTKEFKEEGNRIRNADSGD